MLVRIVKMSFDKSKIDLFLKNFHKNKQLIKNFEGCKLLELNQDINNPSIFFTYSYWKSEEHLNAYKNSDLFKQVWAKTKIYFNERPEAWSIKKIESLS
jgi:hypothetical protein